MTNPITAEMTIPARGVVGMGHVRLLLRGERDPVRHDRAADGSTTFPTTARAHVQAV